MSFRRSAKIQWLPLVLIAAAIGIGIYSVSFKPTASVAAPPDELNVLLITVDTTRADRLGCYGFSDISTPNIDKLAAEGAMFTNCTSPVPITLPAHTSIMTGTYPFVHDVRVNGGTAVSNASVTLAETLKEKGFLTGALVASIVLNSPYNLTQGFDIYDNVPESAQPLEGAEDEADGEAERRGDVMADLTIRWLREFGKKEKFFLWTHFYDPHYPYDPPDGFAGKHAHPYFDEIEFMDVQIGRILDELDRLGLSRNTLVVLAGDHGESCGEHGEESHAYFVYDSTLHVPLIFRLPNRIDQDTVVSQQVRLVDIAPTILDLLGLDIPTNINGVSLVPALNGKSTTEGLEAYSESLYPHAALTFSWLRSLRADGWKYIHAPKPELYHVAEDPGENENLAADHPDMIEDFRLRLLDVIAESPGLETSGDSTQVSLSAEERARLDALGYVGSDAEDLSEFAKNELMKFEPEGVDPKDRMEFITRWCRSGADMKGQDPAKVEKTLRDLIAEEPEIPVLRLRLGTFLSNQGREKEALEVLSEAQKQSPESSKIAQALGSTYHKLNQPDKAAPLLGFSVESSPNDLDARYEFAAVLAELGHREQALAHFLKADKLAGGTFAEVKYNIGVLFSELGRDADAKRAFEWTLRLEPTHANAHYNLGNALYREEAFDKAIEHYRAALASNPKYSDARVNLGVALTKLNRADEAVEVLYEATRIDPENPSGFTRLSQLLSALGRHKEAAEVLTAGMEAQPANVSFAVNLAVLFIKSPEPDVRNPQRAMEILTTLRASAGEDTPELLQIIGMAQAAAGEFDAATATAEQAIELARGQEKPKLIERLQADLDAYREQKTSPVSNE